MAFAATIIISMMITIFLPQKVLSNSCSSDECFYYNIDCDNGCYCDNDGDYCISGCCFNYECNDYSYCDDNDGDLAWWGILLIILGCLVVLACIIGCVRGCVVRNQRAGTRRIIR